MVLRVAVLGASKGCARAMVTQGLEQENPHHYKLLIRNPANLDYTEDQKSKLTIIKGDALDAIAVRKTIANTDITVYSIGSVVDMKARSMVSPGLCHDTMKVLLQVVDELPDDERPKQIVVLSSTGVDDGMKEVPYLFRPMYRFFLHAPHQDKKDMERLIQEENKHLSNWIIIRPSMLTDGKRTGKYRAGVGISGYTVSREDIGHFLLHQCLDYSSPWVKKKVVVTY